MHCKIEGDTSMGRDLLSYRCLNIALQVQPYAVWSKRQQAAKLNAGGRSRQDGSYGSQDGRPQRGSTNAKAAAGTKRKRYRTPCHSDRFNRYFCIFVFNSAAFSNVCNVS